MEAESFIGYLVLLIVLTSFIVAALIVNDSFIYSSIVSILNSFFIMPEILVWIVIYIISLIVSYGVIFLLVYSLLSLKAEDRRNKVEQALPDFLLMVSANMKAGMTLDRAMWYAAKPEFGTLSNEVKTIIKGSFSGMSLEQSLDTLSTRFDSSTFSRTVSLIKQASSSGGEISEVLERTAGNVRDTMIMKKEVSASLVMYQIFLFFSAIVGAPFLFAVGNKLVQIFEKQFAMSMAVPTSSISTGFTTLPSFSKLLITSTEFFYFTIATIFVTVLFSALIVGVIKTGSRSQGIKYVPFMLIGAYLIYWLVDMVLTTIFMSIG